MSITRPKEEKWLVLTEDYEYVDWSREKKEAIELAKELTVKDRRGHIVAQAMFAFEIAVKPCKII